MSPTPKSSAVAGDPENAPQPSRESPKDRPLNESEDPMVLEARRLFGPKAASSGGALAGPLQAGLPVGLLGGGRRCGWGGLDATAEDGPRNGVVEGIVRNQTSGHPLPGAFLQLLGTGSATFSDEQGHYRLTFDPSLVDRCRSQIVRVSAPGYRARNMVLAYGTWSDNTVDMVVR